MKTILSLTLLALGCSLVSADPKVNVKPTPPKDVLTIKPHPNACQAPPPAGKAVFLTGKQARAFVAAQKRRAAQSNKIAKTLQKATTPKGPQTRPVKKTAPELRK